MHGEWLHGYLLPRAFVTRSAHATIIARGGLPSSGFALGSLATIWRWRDRLRLQFTLTFTVYAYASYCTSASLSAP